MASAKSSAVILNFFIICVTPKKAFVKRVFILVHALLFLSPRAYLLMSISVQMIYILHFAKYKRGH